MQAAANTRAEVEREQAWRSQIGVPVAACGVLYLLGGITLFSAVAHRPVVGVLQALQPALNGKASTPVSPELAGVKYLSHHTVSFIVGSLLQAIGLAVLTLVLMFLMRATRTRAPGVLRAAGYLVPAGGIGAAAVTIAHAVVEAIHWHQIAVGHNHTIKHIEDTLTYGALNLTIAVIELLALLALVVGMIMVLLNATRVGLMPRWMRGLGIVGAIILLPIFAASYEFDVLPTAWMVFMGFMLIGKLPSGAPPAWDAGRAIPWDTAGMGAVDAVDENGGPAAGRRSRRRGAGRR
jgi:hypothetical protein